MRQAEPTDLPAVSNRRDFVGASEVAALFGLHPHLSLYTLWHTKLGRLEADPQPETPLMALGKALESHIAAAWMAKKGVAARVVPGKVIHHPTVLKMACTPDYLLPDAVIECKRTSWIAWRDMWGGQPPDHYLLQVQHQLACTGLDRAWLIALVGDEIKEFEIERRPNLIRVIEMQVAAFWSSDEPSPDSSQSTHRSVNKLYAHDDGSDITIYDKDVEATCQRLAEVVAARSALDQEAMKLRARLLQVIGGAAKVDCGPWRISAKTVSPAAVSYQRDAYRRLLVRKKR